MKVLFIFIALCIVNCLAQNPIAAANYLGSGFDAYKGIYGQAPIFDFTYKLGQKITSPYSKIAYDVPDQTFAKPMQRVEEVVFQGSYSSYREYVHMYSSWFSFDVGIETPYFGIGFNYNKQLGFVHKQMNSQMSAVMHGHHYWTYYISSLYPVTFLNMTGMFKLALDRFPTKIVTQEDQEYAYQFVQTFGTHYVYKAVFGAKIDFDTAVNQQITKTYDKEWQSEQFGFYFRYTLANFSFNMGDNETIKYVTKDFLQNSNSDTFFLGGDPTLADLSHLDAWAKTLDQNTYPMNTTVIGLWNLVQDKTKQSTLKQYIVDYISGKINPIQKKRAINKNSCLGAGINIFALNGCLANIYNPTNVFKVNVPESQFDEFSVLMEEQYDINANSHYKYESSGFLGFGSKTKEIYRFYEQHYRGKKSLNKIVLELAYYKLTAPAFPLPKLNTLFETELKNLPVFNNNSIDLYSQFFATWGMAVIDEITLGGYFEMNMWYDMFLNTIYKSEEIIEYSHWSFVGIVNSNHYKNDTKHEIKEDFDKTLFIEYAYVGGLDNFTSSQFDRWALTVQNNPEIIKYHLQPITYFITDTNVRLNVEKALRYFTNKSIWELKEYISMLINS